MTLKWIAVVVSAVSVTLCVTANVLVSTLTGQEVPAVINMFAIAAAGVAIVLAVVADTREQLNARIAALHEFLTQRLEELDTHAGDRNAGFVEGYLLSHNPDAAVVPIKSHQRARRAMTGSEE